VKKKSMTRPTAVARDHFDLLGFAHRLADRASVATLPYFRRALDVDNKAGPNDFDPVTAADRDAEAAISELIRKELPEHGLFGEEFGDHNASAEFKWVIDPVDGTRAFIMGIPLWGTLIGLMRGATPVLGMMCQPFTGERFYGDASGAFLKIGRDAPRPLQTRRCARLQDAILTTTSPDMFTPGAETEAFARLRSQARMTRYGGDCYSYCMLAAGLVDLVVESGLKSFDVVALIPIVERAGGRITTWDGGPAHEGGRIIAAGDPELHARALEILSG
jgi:myo-inositol-1(or 4)-monophosphatase